MMTLCWLLGHDWNDRIVAVDGKKARCCLKCAMVVVLKDQKESEKDDEEEH